MNRAATHTNAQRTIRQPVDSSSEPPVVLKEVAQERSRAALAEDFNALYSRYKRKVFGTVRNVIGPTQELEDIVQNVFLEIHRSLPRYKGTAQLSTWIYRIAVNVSLQYIRKKKRQRVFLFLTERQSRNEGLQSHDPRGQVLALFVIAVAAAEAGIGLGLVIALNRNTPGAGVADLSRLKW